MRRPRLSGVKRADEALKHRWRERVQASYVPVCEQPVSSPLFPSRSQKLLCVLPNLIDVPQFDFSKRNASLLVSYRILNDEDLRSACASAHTKTRNVIVEDNDFGLWWNRCQRTDTFGRELHCHRSLQQGSRHASTAHISGRRFEADQVTRPSSGSSNPHANGPAENGAEGDGDRPLEEKAPTAL
jgi:hypothetical protein